MILLQAKDTTSNIEVGKGQEPKPPSSQASHLYKRQEASVRKHSSVVVRAVDAAFIWLALAFQAPAGAEKRRELNLK